VNEVWEAAVSEAAQAGPTEAVDQPQVSAHTADAFRQLKTLLKLLNERIARETPPVAVRDLTVTTCYLHDHPERLH